jgi:hypothetical protein
MGMTPATDVLTRLRAIFMAFPEVTERLSHGAPTWFIRDKQTIATFWRDGHHEDERSQIWCAALPGAQAELIASDPARYFRPPYVGHRGWIGVCLTSDVDWQEIAEVAEDAYRAIAPKTLIATFDARTND